MAISDNDIFDAVLRIWNEHGLAHTTLKRVGKAAQLEELTLIRRFGTRDELIRLAFEKAVEEVQEAIVHSGNLMADLTLLIDVVRPLLRRRGRLVLDLFLESSRRDDARSMAPVALGLLNQMGTMLAKYQSAGLLRGNDPWVPLLALIGPFFLASFPRGPDRRLPHVSPTLEEFLNGWSASKDRSD